MKTRELLKQQIQDKLKWEIMVLEKTASDIRRFTQKLGKLDSADKKTLKYLDEKIEAKKWILN